jgi:hypothetical protein
MQILRKVYINEPGRSLKSDKGNTSDVQSTTVASRDTQYTCTSPKITTATNRYKAARREWNTSKQKNRH